MSTSAVPPNRQGRLVLSGLMALVTLVGFALRAHDLGSKSLWYDELRQVEVARLPWSEWGEALKIHAARPLDYAITRWLLTVTRSEWLLRFPALVWGTLTIPIVYRLGRRLLGAVEGGIAALLFAFSSLGVIFSQELRPYAIYALASTVSFWMLDRGLRRGTRSAWLKYSAVLAVGVLTHYFWLMIVGAQVVYVAAAAALRSVPARRLLPFAVALAAGGVVLYLTTDPLVVIPLAQNFLSAFFSTTLAHQPPPVSLRAPGFNPFAPTLTYDFLVGRILEQLGAGGGFALWSFNGLCFISLLGWTRARVRPGVFNAPDYSRLPLLLTWLTVGPGFIVAYLFYRNEIFAMRYILFALPPYLLLVARGIVVTANWMERRAGRLARAKAGSARQTGTAAPRRGQVLWLAATSSMLIALTWMNTGYVAAYYRTPKDDWRRVGKFLAANVRPGDAIYAPNAQSFVEFYFPAATDYLVYSDAKREAQYAYGGHERTWFVVSDWVTYDISDTRRLIELLPGVKFQWDKSSFVKFTHRGKSEAEIRVEAERFVVPPASLSNGDAPAVSH